MKKFLCSFLVALLIFANMPTVFAESGQIRVTLDGSQIAFDVAPQIIDGRTMVPLRAIFEALNAEIDWNGETQTVTATRGDVIVIMQVGNSVITVAGKNVTLDVPPLIVNERTLVPARAVAESFGVNVDWNAATQTVILTTGTGNIAPPPSGNIDLYGLQNIENFWIEVNGVRYTLGQPLSRISADIPVSQIQQHLLTEYLRPNATTSVTLQARDAENRVRGLSLSIINFSNENVLFRDAPVTGFRVRSMDVSESFNITFINGILLGQTTRAEIESMFGAPHEISETSSTVTLRYYPFPSRLDPNRRDMTAASYNFTFDLGTNVLTSVAMAFRNQ